MIYGIGAKALGEQLGVEENDASIFIETFKARYTGVLYAILLFNFLWKYNYLNVITVVIFYPSTSGSTSLIVEAVCSRC